MDTHTQNIHMQLQGHYNNIIHLLVARLMISHHYIIEWKTPMGISDCEAHQSWNEQKLPPSCSHISFDRANLIATCESLLLTCSNIPIFTLSQINNQRLCPIIMPLLLSLYIDEIKWPAIVIIIRVGHFRYNCRLKTTWHCMK